jgi:mRNA (2'-O-methyladenosine-N6-)-methyltransferase
MNVTSGMISLQGFDGCELGNVDDLDPREWQVPPHCIPIHANVTTFDWSKLYSVTTFDVIMMDPPWQLATANPTRGVLHKNSTRR